MLVYICHCVNVVVCCVFLWSQLCVFFFNVHGCRVLILKNIKPSQIVVFFLLFFWKWRKKNPRITFYKLCYLCVNRAPLVLYFDRYHVGECGLFVGFTAAVDDVVVLVFFLYIVFHLTQMHTMRILWRKRTGERSIDRTNEMNRKEKKIIWISTSSRRRRRRRQFFMGILMNFVCLRRASIWMNWVFLLLSVFISFKWHGCLEIVMNDAPAN